MNVEKAVKELNNNLNVEDKTFLARIEKNRFPEYEDTFFNLTNGLGIWSDGIRDFKKNIEALSQKGYTFSNLTKDTFTNRKDTALLLMEIYQNILNGKYLLTDLNRNIVNSTLDLIEKKHKENKSLMNEYYDYLSKISNHVE